MDALARYLKENSLSRALFAKRMGTSEATVSRLINGHRKPSPALTLRIEDLTGIPRSRLRPDIYPSESEAA